MSAKRNRSSGNGRVTPKGTQPANQKPKVAHHEEVDKATGEHAHDAVVDHGHQGDGWRQHAPTAPRRSTTGRTNPRGGR